MSKRVFVEFVSGDCDHDIDRLVEVQKQCVASGFEVYVGKIKNATGLLFASSYESYVATSNFCRDMTWRRIRIRANTKIKIIRGIEKQQTLDGSFIEDPAHGA